jgi:N-terminal domain of (some) glycogen debranching enzymes
VDDSDLIILDGCTFTYSNRAGDIEANDPEGFFYEDMRHLSRWCVLVEAGRSSPFRAGAWTLLGPRRRRR